MLIPRVVDSSVSLLNIYHNYKSIVTSDPLRLPWLETYYTVKKVTLIVSFSYYGNYVPIYKRSTYTQFRFFFWYVYTRSITKTTILRTRTDHSLLSSRKFLDFLILNLQTLGSVYIKFFELI